MLAIGIIGLKECVQCLTNNKKTQIEQINKILDHLNDKCTSYSLNTKLNFGIYETTSQKARENLLKIDRAIYGNVENVTDKKKYDLLDLSFIDNNKELSKINDKITLGKLITYKIPANASNKKILEIIEIIKKNNIEFAKVMVGKDEY